MKLRCGAEAMIPNPRLSTVSRFIGEWKTQGTHSMMPGVALHGRTVFEWHEGGGFVCIRSETEEEGIPSAISIIGSDDHSEGHTLLYFDERGVSRRFDCAIEDRVVRWSRLVPGFSQRFTLTLAADGKTMRGVSELSKDDATWERDLELTFTRVT